MNENPACWCGNTQCVPFSRDYLLCPECETLVWTGKGAVSSVNEPGISYYNREYWYSHQTDELGLKDIQTRSRLDLPERCLYWLRIIMKYRLPPAKVLELGSAHGAFVALLQKAGYDAIGLEIDPWIVNYAGQTFGIHMLAGPIEEQDIIPASLDIIVLMDVLEHLPEPQRTLEHCLQILKPEGMIVIQTPMFPQLKTYHDLVNEGHAFLRMLLPKEHIHLFSRKAVEELARRLHLSALIFEPAFFPAHDMFFIASQVSFSAHSPEDLENHLLASPEGRFVLALLDQNDQLSELKRILGAVEADHAARLELINHLDEIIQKQNRILKWMPQNILRRLRRHLSSRSQGTGRNK